MHDTSEWEPEKDAYRIPGMISNAAYDAAALIAETEGLLRWAWTLRSRFPVRFERWLRRGSK